MDGDVILVTGSGSGMGLAAAKRLASPGSCLAVNDRRPELVAGAVAELEGSAARVVGYPADATRPDEVNGLVEQVVSDFGRLDVLVAVVGGIAGPVIGDYWTISDRDWDTTLRVNLSSTFYAMRAAARPMMDQRSGRIVTVSSVSSGGDKDRAHYAAAKAGVVALTRSASDALAPHGITVNAVVPGRTSTGHGGRGDVVLPDNLPPTGRINTPEDVAEAIAFLSSPAARQVSGQLIVVAGGRNPSL